MSDEEVVGSISFTYIMDPRNCGSIQAYHQGREQISTSLHDHHRKFFAPATIDMKLARKVILGKDRLCGAMAISVSINTQWTQQRVANAGYADTDDDKCRLCNHKPMFREVLGY